MPNGSKALIKYSVGNGIMCIRKTYIPPRYHGQGTAIKLARENSWFIKPVCNYSVYYFSKHPENRDVLAPEYKDLTSESGKLFEEKLEEEKV